MICYEAENLRGGTIEAGNIQGKEAVQTVSGS